MYTDFAEKIRTHFNIVHQDNKLSLTLINSNIDKEIIQAIVKEYRLKLQIKKIEIVIIQTPNFDNELLYQLAQCLPQSLKQISLDFSGCQSLSGEGFINIFKRMGLMELQKIYLDLSHVYNINDIFIQTLVTLLGYQENLQDFHIDLYEVDHITEDGYLLLAQILNQLPNLHYLHIDLSANPQLTQDSLELLFSNFPKQLKHLTFRIIDIDQIGGGSFYKLSNTIKILNKLQKLSLTISSFTKINHQGIQQIIQSISNLKILINLQLNFSNINLPSKIFKKLQLSKTLKLFYLDISCNRQLNDFDIINLQNKINYLNYFGLNLDFCDKINQDSIQQLVINLIKNQQCKKIELIDRQYSLDIINNFINNILNNIKPIRISLIPKPQGQKKWKIYKNYQLEKFKKVYIIKCLKNKNISKAQIYQILKIIQ